MKKKISIEEAIDREVKKVVDDHNEKYREANVKIDLSAVCKIASPPVDFEFKYALGKALSEEKVILMAKPDKYRGIGKTVLMSSYFFMKEDMYLVVSDMVRAKLYYPYIPKDRVLAISEIRKGSKGRRVRGGFILDEISYEDYQEVVQRILRPMGKVMGIVSIYKDYEIL